jgi:CDP-6-deoxy-D-xylo-4-hexulose-3-dehydrase
MAKRWGSTKGDMRVFYNQAIFGKEELDAIAEVLSDYMIVGGKQTLQFQKKIAKLFGKKYGVMVNSGSSANLLAFELLDLPEGSEVITPSLTFGTTLSPIFQKRLVPVFVDVVPGTYQIDADQIESHITKKTKALKIPSLFGNIPNLPKIWRIAKKYNLWFIEDSCDTLGATINGKPTGLYSHISTTSFYAPHVITTGGHGGMILFNDDEWLDKVKVLTSWGRSSARDETEKISARFDIKVGDVPYDSKFVFEKLGYNFQSSDIDAAFGLAQLKKFKKFARTRKRNYKKLVEFFKKHKKYFVVPKQNPKAETCWLGFPLVVKDSAPFDRRELSIFLEENGIQTRPVFTGNAMRQPAFKNLKYKKSKSGYPVTDEIMKGSLVIGCHHGMDTKQLNYVKKKFSEFLKQKIK